jgi:hypothetical protein
MIVLLSVRLTLIITVLECFGSHLFCWSVPRRLACSISQWTQADVLLRWSGSTTLAWMTNLWRVWWKKQLVAWTRYYHRALPRWFHVASDLVLNVWNNFLRRLPDLTSTDYCCLSHLWCHWHSLRIDAVLCVVVKQLDSFCSMSDQLGQCIFDNLLTLTRSSRILLDILSGMQAFFVVFTKLPTAYVNVRTHFKCGRSVKASSIFTYIDETSQFEAGVKWLTRLLPGQYLGSSDIYWAGELWTLNMNSSRCRLFLAMAHRECRIV